MEVYLDNSATTKPYDEVMEEVSFVSGQIYGNPSSLHRIGKSAEDKLKECRKIVSDAIGADEKEVFFTSGGSESDNTAIIGYCIANKRSGNRIITQKTEHAAVLESFKYLEQTGFEVVMINVNDKGKVDIDELKSKINDKTILLSFMYANNETGSVFPIDEISSLCDHKKCVLHVDAVQSFGKIPVNVKKEKIDMLSISSHKIHGPKGVGALYIRNSVKISPLILGGKQEMGLRSGTENLPGISGFAKAIQLTSENMECNCEKISYLKNLLKKLCFENIENVVCNSNEDSIYSILNLSFPGVKSEVLLHVLESRGIYVSTGSACNSRKRKFSYVLSEMGLKPDVIDSAVRFSFSAFNTEEEIKYTAQVLSEEVKKLRKIMK